MEKEHLEKRFGVLAVGKGYVTPDEVIEALRIQVMEDVEKGKHRPIGVVLLEQGLITTSQLIDVLEAMEKIQKNCRRNLRCLHFLIGRIS